MIRHFGGCLVGNIHIVIGEKHLVAYCWGKPMICGGSKSKVRTFMRLFFHVNYTRILGIRDPEEHQQRWNRNLDMCGWVNICVSMYFIRADEEGECDSGLKWNVINHPLGMLCGFWDIIFWWFKWCCADSCKVVIFGRYFVRGIASVVCKVSCTHSVKI